MRYAKIEDGTIAKVRSRPRWRTDDGSELTDEELRQHGYVPVEDPGRPEHDRRTHRAQRLPKDAWEIHEDRVVPVYEVEPKSREEIIRAVQRDARKRESEGITYKGHHIDTDPESVTRLTSATVQATRRGKGRSWVNSKGEEVDLTASEIEELADTLDDYIDAILQREKELVKELNEAEDPLEIDIDSGWPDPEDYSS